MNEEKTAVKIAITYDDGSTVELDKGLVFRIADVDENTSTVTAEMLNMSGRDLYTVVSGAIELGQKLGMFDNLGGEEDE